MNVALGGTLYQDLRTQWPKERPPLVRHRARGRVSSSNWVTHPVQLARPDSRLALAVKGRSEPGRRLLDAVLSMHHQAVETLAPGLVVSATAPDGVIEAFEDSLACPLVGGDPVPPGVEYPVALGDGAVHLVCGCQPRL